MAASFPAFARLPAEIRLMIWTNALPDRRVYEIQDTPHSNSKTPAQDGLMFTNRCHEPPSVLVAVCRESRALVHRHYKPLKLHETTKYVDLDRDILLLESYLLIRRLLKTLHFLALMPLVRGRVRHLAFGTSYGFNTGLCHPILNTKTSKKNKVMFLERLARFPRVKKLIFVVHQEFQFNDPWLGSHRPLLLHHNWPPKLYSQFGITPGNPRYFHRNDLQFYPIRTAADRDEEFDMAELSEEEEEDEKWRCCRPSNDDWRCFKRRFLRAMYLNLDKGLCPDHPALKVEGVSLLWIYGRGFPG